MNIETVLNVCLGKHYTTQDYEEYYVDEAEDNRVWFHSHCSQERDRVEENPNYPTVPAQASALTCSVNGRKNGR